MIFTHILNKFNTFFKRQRADKWPSLSELFHKYRFYLTKFGLRSFRAHEFTYQLLGLVFQADNERPNTATIVWGGTYLSATSLVMCSLSSTERMNTVHKCAIWNKFRTYINSAHTISQLLDMKVQRLWSTALLLTPSFFVTRGLYNTIRVWN